MPETTMYTLRMLLATERRLQTRADELWSMFFGPAFAACQTRRAATALNRTLLDAIGPASDERRDWPMHLSLKVMLMWSQHQARWDASSASEPHDPPALPTGALQRLTTFARLTQQHEEACADAWTQECLPRLGMPSSGAAAERAVSELLLDAGCRPGEALPGIMAVETAFFLDAARQRESNPARGRGAMS